MNQYSSNIGEFRFSNRVVEHWNKLTEHVVSSGTVKVIHLRIAMINLLEVVGLYISPISHLDNIFQMASR